MSALFVPNIQSSYFESSVNPNLYPQPDINLNGDFRQTEWHGPIWDNVPTLEEPGLTSPSLQHNARISNRHAG